MMWSNRLLLSEGAALGQLGLSARRSAQHGRAAVTGDSGLSVREHGGDI